MTTWKGTPTRKVNIDGVSFAYRELGTGSDVPVVFLHHLTAVLDDWDPRIIDGMAAHHRVIAFDNRGVGATGSSVPHTVEQMAADAIAFIRALGLEKVDLFGFSLGGGVAQVVALQAPELVRRMILAGTGPRGGGGIDQITKIAAIAYLKACLTFSDPRNFLFFPRTDEGKRAASDYLNRLKERTRDHDLMVASSHSADIARRLPNARLKIYPNSGHGGVFQHHQAFLSDALEFLSATSVFDNVRTTS